jgi:hypothetical protein
MSHPMRSQARPPRRTRPLRDGRRIAAAGFTGGAIASLVLGTPPGIAWGLAVIGLGLLAPSTSPDDELATR